MRHNKVGMMFFTALALAVSIGGTRHAVSQSRDTESITRPVVSENTSPLELIAPGSEGWSSWDRCASQTAR